MNLLGIDFGTKKIGFSLGSTITHHARPLVTLMTNPQLDKEIQGLLKTWRIGLIILGDPGQHENNQRLNAALAQFEQVILSPLLVPIIRWTEQGSSQEAQTLLHDYPSASRDAIAAMLLLQGYLNFHSFTKA